VVILPVMAERGGGMSIFFPFCFMVALCFGDIFFSFYSTGFIFVAASYPYFSSPFIKKSCCIYFVYIFYDNSLLPVPLLSIVVQ
jgi:hypothetical protein